MENKGSIKPHDISFLKALVKKGVSSAGKKLEAIPQPYPDTFDVVDAFVILDQGRAFGMSGPLPIPLSEISEYCSLYRVSDPDRMVRLIRAMDAASLRKSYETQKRAHIGPKSRTSDSRKVKSGLPAETNR